MARLGLRLREERLPVRQLVELARLAEAAGYESVWVPEGSGKDAFSQLTAYALATREIGLATGIVTIFPRSPAILAMTAATLDHLSDQRAILGLGVGHKELLETGHGVVYDRPVRRMREYVTLVRGILHGQALPPAVVVPVTRFRLDFIPERAELPIYVAALGPQMCRLAGEVADGVLLNWATPGYAAEAVAEVRAGAERAGRDGRAVDVACYIRAAVGEDPAAVARSLALETARYVALDFYRRMFDRSGFARETAAVVAALPQGIEAAAARVSDRMLEAVALFGDDAAWRKRLGEYRALGVALPVIAPVPVGPDAFRSWSEAIRTFAG
ncbi:MAG: LLM class flavin-dependent oxidoreductase [Candidatus Rokubacteria bacterium]|nr:LLM class flavin-dependent oxidoreductase [Candidatus Rokubacteria bacterium]